MNSDFEKILLSLRPKNMRTVSVANAIDANVLASLMTAHKMGFINAILCGNENEIRQDCIFYKKKKKSCAGC